jgi:glycerate dehydrogenase
MAIRIVVLDGYTLNPGDISWAGFEKLGQLEVHDRTPASQIVERAASAQVVLTNKVPLNADSLSKLPDLKYIGVLATGYNVIDIAAAHQRGVTVTNVPAYSTESVAQHGISLLLELARRTGQHAQAVREGQWSKSADFCFALGPITELSGKTFGVVGMGKIGIATARIAAAMGMKIIAASVSGAGPRPVPGLDVSFVSLDELFATSDVVSLHCPLTPKTDKLINADRIAKMKPSAFLVNTARGQLIDNQALADALNQGRLAGAGLDVLDIEPPPASNPLIGAKNCVITPHLAWYSIEARIRLMQIATSNLEAYLAGKPVNVIKPQ